MHNTSPVLDDPVVFVGGAVPDHQHTVVETVCTTAAVSVDTTGVELEAIARGIDSYTVGGEGEVRRECGRVRRRVWSIGGKEGGRENCVVVRKCGGEG